MPCHSWKHWTLSPDQFKILFFLLTSCSSKLSKKESLSFAASSEILQEQVLPICLCSFVQWMLVSCCPDPIPLRGEQSQRVHLLSVKIAPHLRIVNTLCSITSFLIEKHRFLSLSFPKTPGLRVSCCLALGLRSSGTYEIQGVGSGGAPMHLHNGRHF